MGYVDSNALTLAQYAAISNDPLVQRVTASLLNYGNVLQDIPLVTDPTTIMNGVRWTGNLPQPSWVPVNTDPTAVSGTPTPWQEQVYLVRNTVQTDNVFVIDKNQIRDPRAIQVEGYLEGLTYDINDKFINNNHVAGDEHCFVGLRTRLDSPGIWGIPTEMKINGNVVLTPAGTTAATANALFRALDQLLFLMGSPEGDDVYFYINDELGRSINQAARTLGPAAGFRMDVDNYDRSVTKYKNATFRQIGRKADQVSDIITNTEKTDGTADGTGKCTSLYGVRYGDTAFLGWQMYPLVPRDLGLLPNGVTHQIVFDWAFGLAQIHTRALGRIYNIQVLP
jgi:hypothetical protein